MKTILLLVVLALTLNLSTAADDPGRTLYFVGTVTGVAEKGAAWIAARDWKPYKNPQGTKPEEVTGTFLLLNYSNAGAPLYDGAKIEFYARPAAVVTATNSFGEKETHRSLEYVAPTAAAPAKPGDWMHQPGRTALDQKPRH